MIFAKAIHNGIDIFSKEVEVKLLPSLTAVDGLNFLEFSFEDRFKHTNLLQSDGGPEFKVEFSHNVFKYADRLRRARLHTVFDKRRLYILLL